jgi:hypothetical protein
MMRRFALLPASAAATVVLFGAHAFGLSEDEAIGQAQLATQQVEADTLAESGLPWPA